MLDEHYGYVSDTSRLEQFQAALSSVIKPGDHCVDIGSGTGVLGLLALRAGAEHVHCIEETRLLSVARETYERAGRSRQVTFYQGRSQQVTLPRLADVLVCDHVGYFGMDYGIVPLMEDAALRFLRPGGKIVPRLLHLEIAAVASATCADLAHRWSRENIPCELRWLHEYEANTKHRVGLKPQDVLTDAASLGDIDLRETNPSYFTWEASVAVRRAGLLDGLCGWFDCELAPGVSMTNSPLSAARINRAQAFFPFGAAISVQEGDQLQVKVLARAAGDIFSWTVELPERGVCQTHTNWKSQILSDADLTDAGPGHVPVLTPLAEARKTVLACCDGQRTAAQIEQAMVSGFPDLFPSAAEARAFVQSVLKKDARPW